VPRGSLGLMGMIVKYCTPVSQIGLQTRTPGVRVIQPVGPAPLCHQGHCCSAVSGAKKNQFVACTRCAAPWQFIVENPSAQPPLVAAATASRTSYLLSKQMSCGRTWLTRKYLFRYTLCSAAIAGGICEALALASQHTYTQIIITDHHHVSAAKCCESNQEM